MTAPDYGRAFALWRQGAGEAWRDYTHHAFVEGLRDGTLPQPAFLHYLAQDYVFLIHFSRAWALAAAKAGRMAEMTACAATLHALVHEEMPMHVRTCAAAGISAEALEATREAPENLAYTRYVLEAGYSGDFLDLMAALAPCVLGYGEIGARLSGADTPYREWVETYASGGYQDLCREVGGLIDAGLEHRLGPNWQDLPRWATLGRRFETATRLEIGFWDMGLRGA